MIKRLEQVAALVVAAGLALVSYWLFFSWAQGGGAHRRQKPGPTSGAPPLVHQAVAAASKASTGFEEPLLGGAVIQPSDVVAHLLAGDRKTPTLTNLNDATQGSRGVLQGLTKEGLSEV